MSGYWNDPETTQRIMIDGWIATGDAGHLDADGYLWFDARIKQIIICDGDNIYPSEVERAINSHPAVSHVAVFGMPDEAHGERVAAAIVLQLDARLDKHDLQEFLEPDLAAGKIPTDWLFTDALPYGVNGKLDLKSLQTMCS